MAEWCAFTERNLDFVFHAADSVTLQNFFGNQDYKPVQEVRLSDGTVLVVTEQDGQDDRRAARFRFVYLLGEKQCSIQKLVRFTPEEAFFERHIYRWNR